MTVNFSLTSFTVGLADYAHVPILLVVRSMG